MASEVCGLIQDLNLNDHSIVTTGASVVEKDDVLKGGFGGSKAYGDLSKCGKPAMTEESSQKQQPSDIDEINIKRKGGVVTEEDIADEDSDYDYDFFDERVVKRSDPTKEEILEIMAYEHDHRRCIELQEKALKEEYAFENPAYSPFFDWPWEEEFEIKPMDESELEEISDSVLVLVEVDGTYECVDAATVLG
ncbi:hypothetical protein RchiOBHm_Chr7g0177931 [Rosa chinensis]|uniref:Uncharacterized protein n=1 Tax=Rosa chinensis TaxID=74649 RepID=A0A2P6P1P3_ROSCH|nr:uncharacterized protein LOC112176208 isoform X1 [Rosa chinensis]XP_040365838.1 uncharacterized protein LOC112176208 isoform X1 [Rosa chinensis]PRQ15854.1 hypothetical protein RchiOBHm_Chr7g0177931 [Rosa chinensis]